MIGLSTREIGVKRHSILGYKKSNIEHWVTTLHFR